MKNINDMTVDELKVVAYDLLAILQKNQADLQVVNNLIGQKSAEQKVEQKDVHTT